MIYFHEIDNVIMAMWKFTLLRIRNCHSVSRCSPCNRLPVVRARQPYVSLSTVQLFSCHRTRTAYMWTRWTECVVLYEKTNLDVSFILLGFESSTKLESASFELESCAREFDAFAAMRSTLFMFSKIAFSAQSIWPAHELRVPWWLWLEGKFGFGGQWMRGVVKWDAHYGVQIWFPWDALLRNSLARV